MAFFTAFKDFFTALKARFFPGGISLGKITPTGVGSITRQYRMNYFDPGENSNKVWIGIAYSDGSFETQFGRVRDGANLVSSRKKFASQIAAENELERKRREKLRKGYKDTVVLDNTVQTAIVKDKQDKLSKIAADEIEGSADKVTSELIKYLAEINIHHHAFDEYKVQHKNRSVLDTAWRAHT